MNQGKDAKRSELVRKFFSIEVVFSSEGPADEVLFGLSIFMAFSSADSSIFISLRRKGCSSGRCLGNKMPYYVSYGFLRSVLPRDLAKEETFLESY